jgi:hypothetical protein
MNKPSEQKLKHALSNVSSIYEHNIVLIKLLLGFNLITIIVL